MKKYVYTQSTCEACTCRHIQKSKAIIKRKVIEQKQIENLYAGVGKVKVREVHVQVVKCRLVMGFQ